MIAQMVNQMVLSGVTNDMPETQRDELKLMNSIAFHSVLLTFFTGIAAWLVIPKHAFFRELGCNDGNDCQSLRNPPQPCTYVPNCKDCFFLYYPVRISTHHLVLRVGAKHSVSHFNPFHHVDDRLQKQLIF